MYTVGIHQQHLKKKEKRKNPTHIQRSLYVFVDYDNEMSKLLNYSVVRSIMEQ